MEGRSKATASWPEGNWSPAPAPALARQSPAGLLPPARQSAFTIREAVQLQAMCRATNGVRLGTGLVALVDETQQLADFIIEREAELAGAQDEARPRSWVVS